MLTYAEDLKKNYKTQTERKSVVNSMFDFTNKICAEIETVQKFADLIINDIDQAAWTLKSFIDCLKINDVVVRNGV